jgi:aspartyl-tRNA(Asn)/glutamyl-tRNA(Gln) amidotransferase subunit C
MSLEIKDIEHLANLSRIALTEEEKVSLLKDFEAILGYVGELSKVDTGDVEQTFVHINITKDDSLSPGSGEYTEKILESAPKRNGSYVEAQQVFNL